LEQLEIVKMDKNRAKNPKIDEKAFIFDDF